MDQVARMNEAAHYVFGLTKIRPQIGIVLGSGLGAFSDDLENRIIIPYVDIPYFSSVGTVGHQGQLVVGYSNGVALAVMQGRFHYFESGAFADVVFPIRVLKAMGVDTVILTNSAGAINQDFHVGDLMLITDHLNLVGNNPLIGINDDRIGPRFPDATEIYSKNLQAIAINSAETLGIILREGIYAWWSGPAYETPAEIRMIRMMGADAIGMSTVPEALVATHMGMKVLGISCLTNMAAGIMPSPLLHQDILNVAQASVIKINTLLKTIIAEIGKRR